MPPLQAGHLNGPCDGGMVSVMSAEAWTQVVQVGRSCSPGCHCEDGVGIGAALLDRHLAQEGVVLGHQEQGRCADVGNVLLTGPVPVVLLSAAVPAQPPGKPWIQVWYFQSEQWG